jgi:hypothetical protein
MSENSLPETRWRRLLLGACCVFAVFVGVHRLLTDFLLSPVDIGVFESELFDSDPGRTLRIIESVGILLPLFVGLLRFSTSDQSGVSERVNDYLLLGILGLVSGGVFATLAGMVTDIAGILKISLFFVFLTFAVIAVAASLMFRDVPSSMNRLASNRGRDRTNDGDAPTRDSEVGTDDCGRLDSSNADASGNQSDEKLAKKAETRQTTGMEECSEAKSTGLDGGRK